MQEAEDIIKQLQSKVYKPVYFLQGEEEFYIDKVCDFIEDKILTDSEKGFNQTVVYGKDVEVNTILQHAKRYPMMSEKQVVIVKEAQEIKDLGKESGQEAMIQYLNNPLTSTILVFAHKNKVLDMRKSLGKEIAKKAVLLTTKKLYENQIPDWINKYVSEKGYKIAIKSSNLIAASVGNNLSTITNELGKIFINLKPGEEINENHVEKNIGLSKEYNVFELNNAILFKDILKANKIIKYFSANPKAAPLVVVVSNLYSTFVKILLTHSATDKSGPALGSLLGVNPYFTKDYISATQKYSLNSCVRIISYLREADGKSKGVNSGDASDYDISKELIFKILHT